MEGVKDYGYECIGFGQVISCSVWTHIIAMVVEEFSV